MSHSSTVPEAKQSVYVCIYNNNNQYSKRCHMGVKSVWKVSANTIISTEAGHWLNTVSECLGGKYMCCGEH